MRPPIGAYNRGEQALKEKDIEILKLQERINKLEKKQKNNESDSGSSDNEAAVDKTKSDKKRAESVLKTSKNI